MFDIIIVNRFIQVSRKKYFSGYFGEYNDFVFGNWINFRIGKAETPQVTESFQFISQNFLPQYGVYHDEMGWQKRQEFFIIT